MYILDKVYIFEYNGGVEGVLNMVSVNATDVRKNWSTYLDNVRNKPVFIKRTHDFSALMDIKSLKLALSYVPITYSKVTDEDGSIVFSSNSAVRIPPAVTCALSIPIGSVSGTSKCFTTRTTSSS